MPNWCYNQLKVTGPTESLKKFYEAFRGHHAFYPISREEYTPNPSPFLPIIPLPNETYEDYSERARAEHFATPAHHCFNALFPVPEEVLIWGFDGHSKPGYKSAPFRSLVAGNMSEQTMDGYHWQNAHWGTKWDVNEHDLSFEETDEAGVYNFDTAWSPPNPWLQHVSAMFPELLFTINYTEEGNQYVGELNWREGVSFGLEADGRDEAVYWAVYLYINEQRGDDTAMILDNFSDYEPDTLANIRADVSRALMDKDSLEDNPLLSRTQFEDYLKRLYDIIDEAIPMSIKNAEEYQEKYGNKDITEEE